MNRILLRSKSANSPRFKLRRFESTKAPNNVESNKSSEAVSQTGSSGIGKFLFFGVPLGIGAGTVAYAAYDKDFRNMLATLPGGQVITDQIPDYSANKSASNAVEPMLSIQSKPKEDKLKKLEEQYLSKVQAQSLKIEELEKIVNELSVKSKEWENVDAFSLEFRKSTNDAINRARRRANSDVIIDEKDVEEALIEQRKTLDAEFAKESKSLRDEFEKSLNEQLKRQINVHTEALAEQLKKQEVRLTNEFEKDLTFELAKQRSAFDGEIAAAMARLKGIEAAVDARADAEKNFQKSKELWLACHSMRQLLEKGAPGNDWDSKLLPLKEAVDKVEEAAAHHPFVKEIISNMKPETINRGAYTLDSLRERFDVVRKEARKVAMVDKNEDTSLFKYILSQVQSWLILDSNLDFSHSEKLNPDDLETFSILASARKCLEEGNIDLAVRFMNQLKGLPKQVASEWVKEARNYLESKQAAEILLAHAAANGLETIPTQMRK